MTAKKSTVKKEVVKSEPKKQSPIKQEYKGVFPDKEVVIKQKWDLNYIAIGRRIRKIIAYKSNEVKEQDIVLDSKPELVNLSIQEYINLINDKLCKLYEKYCVVWDFYINKKQNLMIETRFREIDEYGKR